MSASNHSVDPNLDHIRYITRHYSALKGLKLVPFGIFMLLMAAQNLGWTWLGKQGDCTYTLPLMILLIGLYFLIDRYYGRTFGEVKPSVEDNNPLISVLVLVIFVGAIILEWILKPQISLMGISIGGLLMFSGIKTRRIYYTIGGALFIILAVLIPFVFGQSVRQVGTYSFWFNATMGLLWIILGLIDHFTLVRALKPLSGGEYGRSE